jgi:hypothetical protein
MSNNRDVQQEGMSNKRGRPTRGDVQQEGMSNNPALLDSRFKGAGLLEKRRILRRLHCEIRQPSNTGKENSNHYILNSTSLLILRRLPLFWVLAAPPIASSLLSLPFQPATHNAGFHAKYEHSWL